MKRYIFQNVRITTFYRDRQISFQTDEWRFISALVTSNLEFFAAHKKSYLIACSFYMKRFMKKGTPIKNKKKLEFDKKEFEKCFHPLLLKIQCIKHVYNGLRSIERFLHHQSMIYNCPIEFSSKIHSEYRMIELYPPLI